MFILGFFWKRTTSNAALFATIGGFILSVVFKAMPNFTDLSWLSPYGFSKLVEQKDGSMLYEIPFLDRMGFVFVICIVAMFIISKLENRTGVNPKGLDIDVSMFKTNKTFAAGALIICGIIVALYSIFW